MEKFGKKDLEDLVERLSKGADRKDLTLHRTQAADGTITERWQMDSEEDVKLFRQAQAQANAAEVAAIGVLDPTPVRRTHASRPQVTETISLEKARDAWLASIKPRTLPKTYTIKLAAVESLVSFLGPKSKLHTVSRPDLARWYQHLRDNGASTPTLTPKSRKKKKNFVMLCKSLSRTRKSCWLPRQRSTLKTSTARCLSSSSTSLPNKRLN
ncbi:hypothetical protein [Stenotrophomonas sp. TWI819]|uniref:hypothetical protein n=1 Tax=Stenotrophomonas sp. TWI819 TaxID=3136800 RepID=UPI00320B8FBF